MEFKDIKTYKKFGEIYFLNFTDCSILCTSCNEIFTDFNEFRNHATKHLYEEIVVKDEDDFAFENDIHNTSSLLELSDSDDNYMEDDKSALNEIVRHFSHQNSDINIDIGNSETGIIAGNEVEKFEISTNDHLDLNFEQKFDNFQKMLPGGQFGCKKCSRYFGYFKDLYDHHLVEKHCSQNKSCTVCVLHSDLNENAASRSNSFCLDENNFECNINNLENISPKNFQTDNDIESKSTSDSDCEINNQIESNQNIYYDIANVPRRNFKKFNYKHKCIVCQKAFKHNYLLQTHLKIHKNDRPYKCNLCSSAFTVPSHLKTHFIYKHTDERPFVCKYDGCNASFKVVGLKVIHEKTHLPAKFQCEKCGNYYKTKSNLTKHQHSVHVDYENRRHNCDICLKKFTRIEHLIDHKRIHTGEKPFGCTECSKFFSKQSSLREHKKLHSEEKKHACKICGMRFKQKSGYLGHLKRHQNISKICE